MNSQNDKKKNKNKNQKTKHLSDILTVPVMKRYTSMVSQGLAPRKQISLEDWGAEWHVDAGHSQAQGLFLN